jgi:hypothetical protein
MTTSESLSKMIRFHSANQFLSFFLDTKFIFSPPSSTHTHTHTHTHTELNFFYTAFGNYFYNILVAKSEEKRQCGRPSCRWEYNIGMDLREMGGKVWTGFIWLRTGTSGGIL